MFTKTKNLRKLQKQKNIVTLVWPNRNIKQLNWLKGTVSATNDSCFCLTVEEGIILIIDQCVVSSVNAQECTIIMK